MGKKNKGKKQEQDAPQHKKSEDEIQPPATNRGGDDHDNLENSAVLIQPNENQQKIINEILKDVEDEDDDDKEVITSQEKAVVEEEQGEKQNQPSSNAQQANLIDIDVSIINQTPQTQEPEIITPNDQPSSIPNQVEQPAQNQNQEQQQEEQQTNQPPLPAQQIEQPIQEESRFVVNIFDQARSGYLLPWSYAIENEMISPLEYDHDGHHLIHRAAAYNQLDVVHALIEKHGVPVDLLERTQKQTPLIIASLYGHFKLIKYLVDKGANVNASDNNKFTPVVNSVMNRYKLQAIYLMSKGADLSVLDQDNCNLAHRAAFNNDVPMLQLINQVARSQFEQKDKYKLAPVGRAITNDSHQAFKYLQRASPIPVPDKNFDSLPNRCMANLINEEYSRQNIKCFSKWWLLDCYKSRPKDMCIFMYAILIGTLYYHFVLQTGTIYHLSNNHYYFCNVIHALTAFLMTYIFIFVLKSECPSHNLKLGLHTGAKNINFNKLDKSKVNFKHLDRLFGYTGKQEDTGEEIDDEEEEEQQQQNKNQSQKTNEPSKRTRLNVLDYIAILVENGKFNELKKLNDYNICYECLDLKEDRYHHSFRFGFCVKNFSHYSKIFDKLIVKGTNDQQFYLIIALQWILLVLFFVANYLYCSSKSEFQGWFIFTFLEIPFQYYLRVEWKYLAIYCFASILFYVASIYFFIETFGICMNLTRYEIFYPNRCHYFYKNNIQEINSRARYSQEQSSSYYKYYENPYSRCRPPHQIHYTNV